MEQYSEPKDVNLVYLEHPNNNQFFEVSETNNALRIRRGEISKPCLVFNATYKTANKGREIFERLIKNWKGQGYVVTQASNTIIEGSIANELFAAEIEDHPVYSKFFNLGWASELRGKQERIFHFRNGLRYEGHLDLEDTADMGLASGLIIEGGVQVSGVFSQMTYTYPTAILITGSVHAQSLAHKDSHMFIEGDVQVENVVYGEYNDGWLEITGDVYGKAFISFDHAMEVYGNYYLPRFDWGDEDIGWLSPKIFDFEGNLDDEVLRGYIWAGKSLLRKGFVFTAPKSKESQAKPEELEESELTQEMQALVLAEDTNGMVELLENWPERDEEWEQMLDLHLDEPSMTAEQLERLTKLKNNLFEKEELEENPQNVFRVEVVNKLIELEDSGADFESEEVKNWLESIDKLHITAENLERIPKSLGKLTRLKSLMLTMIKPNGQKLPDSLGKLTNLEELSLAWSGFTNLPAGLSELNKLKMLSIMDNEITKLPSLPTSLEHLVLDENPLKSIDLSKLVNLKFLSLDGIKIIPVGLENLLNLEALSWNNGKLKTFPKILLSLPAIKQLGLSDNSFTTFPSLDRLEQLEVLNLENCQLEHLPKGLLELTNLKTLLLKGNVKLVNLLEKGKDPTQLQILEQLQNRGVELGDLDKDIKATRMLKSLKKAKRLNKAASKQQEKEASEALVKYEQAIELCSEFLEDFSKDDTLRYNYIFALQGELWCLNDLVEKGKPEHQIEVESLARNLLEYTKNHEALFYSSEEGQFARTAELLAHNTLAWYGLKKGRDLIEAGEVATAVLEEALEHINIAVEEKLEWNSKEEEYSTVLKNKVEILLALGQSYEAYALVYQVQRRFPDLPYFKKVAQTPVYQQWNEEN